MNLKKIICALGMIAIGGCTTTAATQGYRPSGSTDAPLQIGGELFDITNVRIFINGTKVIDKRLSLLDGEGEFQSYYRDMNVNASCTQSMGLVKATTKCFVFVNNERAATLTF